MFVVSPEYFGIFGTIHPHIVYWSVLVSEREGNSIHPGGNYVIICPSHFLYDYGNFVELDLIITIIISEIKDNQCQ